MSAVPTDLIATILTAHGVPADVAATAAEQAMSAPTGTHDDLSGLHPTQVRAADLITAALIRAGRQHPDRRAAWVVRTAVRLATEQRIAPNWAPLEHLASMGLVNMDDWMWMSRLTHPNQTVIEQYKHRDSRRYLNLSADGQAWLVAYTALDTPPVVTPAVLAAVLAVTAS